VTSKTRWGTAARRAGLFLVPSETTGLAIVDRYDALVAASGAKMPVTKDGIARDSDALLTA
jgi:hypothetical protein